MTVKIRQSTRLLLLSASTAAPTPDGADDGETAADELDAEEVSAFCEASAEYWAASDSANHINLDRPGEVAALYGLMDDRLTEAIDLAPNDEMAAPALLAREHFDIVEAALEQENFDLDVFEAGGGLAEVESSVRTLAGIDDQLNEFLIGPCGYSQSELDAGGEAVAADLKRLVDDFLADGDGGSDSDSDGDSIDYPGDYIEVVDSTDRLKVEVPLDWEDTQSEPSGVGSALVVAPDVSEYLTSWRADGMKMTVRDAGDPIDWRAPMYDTTASAECTLVSSEPYSDPLYTGWIDRYDECGGGPATAVVIGATDEEFSVEILVEVQFDDVDTQNDEGTLQQIIDTFKAR
jgi:hypothetical protein